MLQEKQIMAGKTFIKIRLFFVRNGDNSGIRETL